MVTLQQANDYLKAMGIERWSLREKNNRDGEKIFPSDSNIVEDLKKCISDCKKCDLYKSRTQTVFGTGSLQAKVMFIGEAPGAEEDRQGKPFVGRAGQLLTQMLKSIGLSREEVFIANILKCRPPNNRDPNTEEVNQCTPYLIQQINLIQPKLLVSLGRISAHYLLNTKTSLSALRGKNWEYNHIPLLVTYHPAYLLRTPQDKSKAFEDLLKIKSMLLNMKSLSYSENEIRPC